MQSGRRNTRASRALSGELTEIFCVHVLAGRHREYARAVDPSFVASEFIGNATHCLRIAQAGSDTFSEQSLSKTYTPRLQDAENFTSPEPEPWHKSCILSDHPDGKGDAISKARRSGAQLGRS